MTNFEPKENTMPAVSVATAKSRLSELLAKTSYAHERFIITRRNKPVAALVSLEDLKLIEQSEERQGLASIIGKWNGFEEVEELISNTASLRTDSGTRQNVSL
jgi:prevent-host-death family protein